MIAWLEIPQGRKHRRRLLRQIRGLRFNAPIDTAATGGAAGAAGAAPAAQPSTPPTATPNSSTPATPAPSSAVGPGTSGLPAAGATPPTATPAQPQAPSFEDLVRQRYGMDEPMLRTLATLGYQHYRSQGQTPPAPAAQPAAQPAANKNPFGLAPFDYRYLDYVLKGPNGLELAPGAPPDALHVVQTHQAALREVQQKFFHDPMQFLGDEVDRRAEAKAEAIFNKLYSGHQAQSASQRIIQENSDWLFEKDQSGQVVMQFNPATGQDEQKMSALGSFYLQGVRAAASMGITDPTHRHEYAKAQVENAVLRQRFQQQQAPAAGAAAASTFLNGAGGATVPPPPPPTAASPAPTAVPMTLKQMFERNFEANGLTDEVVRRQTVRA